MRKHTIQSIEMSLDIWAHAAHAPRAQIMFDLRLQMPHLRQATEVHLSGPMRS